MNIVICCNHFWPLTGGSECVTLKIARHLSSSHKVSVITRKVANRSKNFDIPIYEYTPQNWGLFAKHLANLNADVVFVYSDVFDFFRPLISLNRPKFRIAVALCGANWLYSNKAFVNTFYRKIDAIKCIICHSQFDRDYRLCSTEPLLSKTFIIPNGVDTSEFDNNHFTREDLQPDLLDRRWILNVSNFFPGKGQHHLVDIINQIPTPKNIAYLQICSDIDFSIGQVLEDKWKRDIHKINKGVVVKLLKNITREQTVGYFKQSNVFAFTSEKEVAPLVILESMASQLPWVATDVGHVRGLKGGKYIPALKDTKFHSCIDERVKRIFADYLLQLWDNRSVGEEGRLQIDKELTWDKILPMYSSVLD